MKNELESRLRQRIAMVNRIKGKSVVDAFIMPVSKGAAIQFSARKSGSTLCVMIDLLPHEVKSLRRGTRSLSLDRKLEV